MDAMEIDEPNASSSSATGSLAPPSPALNSQTISTSTTPDPQPPTRRRSSSFRRLSFSKIKSQASAGARFAAGMVALPIIGEMLEGVCDGFKAYENTGSNRHGLVELKQRLETMLNMLRSEPRLLNTDRAYAHFTECMENLHIRVQDELAADGMRRLEVAAKLDDFSREFTDLLAEAIKAGHIQQRVVIVPEEFDRTIPSLKIVKESNGLVIRELISTEQYGDTVVDFRDQLYVNTYQAMYNDVPVEVEEYFGGPDDYLVQTVAELVDNYHQRCLNPILQQLHGGFVFRDPSNRLRAYLVLSPREGTPWVQLINSKQSIELLCQIAEKTAIVFDQLKQNKQMNFKDIRVRSDGTLLLVPHTEGNKHLMNEDVFDPFEVGKDVEDKIGWPFATLCRILHESSKQGLVPKAVAALRDHDGIWDRIAVWRIARRIGLRPPATRVTFECYPSRQWAIDPGWIIHWQESGRSMPDYPWCFNLVDKLPKSMLHKYEQQHLTSFMITYPMGKRGDELVNYFEADGEYWFLPAQQKDWEYVPLKDWEGVEHITLNYESVRLDMVEWDKWKNTLKDVAWEKDLRKEDLAVVSMTDVTIRICKEDVPELGTRPIYFYRRKAGADTSPQQFWGFFTFNEDPLGPTGLTVRHSGPGQSARIVSESLPPDPADYKQKWTHLEIAIEFVEMINDWSVRIKNNRE
ncbi:unnamed protein product [Rhizoctonia solani]|uniref:Uncharacterized protein n=1 Tax=Rhizoctonia solani TaxID=456999 RepID=A0A8H3H6P1_9AGAM|nr:unnamed protein product [Rhizoctonia solani]